MTKAKHDQRNALPNHHQVTIYFLFRISFSNAWPKQSQAKQSQAKPRQAKLSQTKQSQAKPSQAMQSQTKPSQTSEAKLILKRTKAKHAKQVNSEEKVQRAKRANTKSWRNHDLLSGINFLYEQAKQYQSMIEAKQSKAKSS